MSAVEEIRKMLLLGQDLASGRPRGDALEGWDDAFAALAKLEMSEAVRADGESWESYAHRLEARIKEQRDDLKRLAALRDGPRRKAKEKIARLERMLGHKEMRLDQQHDGLRALQKALDEATGANGVIFSVRDALDRCGTETSMVYVHENDRLPACAVIVRAETLAWDRVHAGMPELGSDGDEPHDHVEPGMW